MKLDFIDASAIEPAQWDRLVERSPDGWVWALSGWQRLILNVREWAFEDHSFAARDGDRLIVVMPLQYDRAARRIGSSAWGVAGPVLDGGLDAAARARVLGAVLREAERRAVRAGALRFELGRSPLVPSSLNTPWGVNPWVDHGYHDTSTNTRMLDLSVGIDVLWRGVSENARRKIKLARSRGMTVRQVDWLASLDVYYEAHCETYTRTGVRPHPRAYFEGIAREMAPRGHALLHAAFDGDRPIAFRNDARFGEGVLYHTGCSLNEALVSGANYLLVWASIEAAARDGFRWYETGEVFPAATSGKDHGLTEFKSRFGGELHRYFKSFKTFDEPAVVDEGGEGAGDAPEKDIRSAYEHGTLYGTARICRKLQQDATEYADRLLQDRVALVREFDRGGRLVDLCCAAGEHLVDVAAGRDAMSIGVDFSTRYLQAARTLVATRGDKHVALVQGDARSLPLAAGSVSLLYSFSSLYAIPNAEAVVAEVGRVLADGGYAVLDFGNRRSLNVFCLRYYTEWPAPHPLTLGEIAEALRRAGLEVVKHRRFQLLPLWADRPSWLWPLLHPAWKRVMKTYLGGRMLDEWVSSLPLLRRFAFRHLIVCRKALMGARG